MVRVVVIIGDVDALLSKSCLRRRQHIHTIKHPSPHVINNVTKKIAIVILCMLLLRVIVICETNVDNGDD
jgi:hypothetical protein